MWKGTSCENCYLWICRQRICVCCSCVSGIPLARVCISRGGFLGAGEGEEGSPAASPRQHLASGLWHPCQSHRGSPGDVREKESNVYRDAVICLRGPRKRCETNLRQDEGPGAQHSSPGRSSLEAGEASPLEGATWRSPAPLCSPPPAASRVRAGKRSLNCSRITRGSRWAAVGVMGSFWEAKEPSSCPLWQPGPSPCRKPQGRSVRMDTDLSSSLLTLIYSFGRRPDIDPWVFSCRPAFRNWSSLFFLLPPQ